MVASHLFCCMCTSVSTQGADVEDSPYCHLSQSASCIVLKLKMEQFVNEHHMEKTEYTFPRSEESSLKLQRIEDTVSLKSAYAAQ